MTRILHAPYPIRRPYTPLFMSLREQANVLIERMEPKSSSPLPTSGRQLETEEWEAYNPGLIIATIDWDNARLVLSWAVDDDKPVRAERSPDYVLDLSELRQAADATERPRAFFDSNALHILSVAQHYLIEFFRDGPTDDIPFHRHLIHGQGMDGDDALVWVSNVIFTWDETRD